MASKISEAEIREMLESLKGWERHGDMLVRLWQFHSFKRALEFVEQLATVFERYGHYPDIIISFRNVRVEISTHEAGGLTAQDFEMAREIGDLPTER